MRHFVKYTGRFFALFFFIFLAGFVVAQESEWYQDKPIRDIIFEGLRHIDSSELDSVKEAYIGKPFSDDIFWELQERLYATEFFEVISPTAVPSDDAGTAVVIRFQVTERPVVSRINFSGNAHVRRTELLNTITIKPDDVVNQLKLRLDETAVYEKYLEKGYPDIKVRSETQTNPNGTITVTFFIEEGNKIAVRAFYFEGNSTFSERTLRGQLSLKPKGVFNDGAFQEAKLIADREAITQYYHDRGYIDAEVIDVVRETVSDEKGNNFLDIFFRIYEGEIYSFRGIEFTGNKIFTARQLAAQVRSKEGEVANARRIEADLQRVADLYYESGYIFNSITRTERRDLNEKAVSYEVNIIERGRAHIERIRLVGNNKTKDHVILREIPLEPGDVFSKAKVMDAYRNLMNLQYFSNVIPEPTPGSAESLMDLVITMEEQPTTNLQFGITFTGTSDPNEFPIAGILQIQDRNFLGYGNILGLQLDVSRDTQAISFQYTHRWIFGLPLSGSFDLTVNHSKRLALMDNSGPFFNGDEPYAYPDGFSSYDEYESASYIPANEFLMTYDQWSISPGFSTGYRWLTFLGNLGLSGGLRTAFVINTYDEVKLRPFDPILRESNKGVVPALSFWTSVSLDQRDIYYDPSKGYYGIQRFGYFGFLDIEREHYMKTETKAEVFFTLFDLPITDTYSFKGVFGIHSGLSFIWPQPGRKQAEIEAANKLAVDGMFIGRGWSSARLSTRGLALWENWAELRFPVVPGIIALDFFFDAAVSGVNTRDGRVELKPEQFFDRPFTELLNSAYFSFGVGPRISIPQFPFRFLFAKGFRIIDGEFQWKRGALGATDNPGSGIDFVLSISLSTY
ncbi:MAG: outer membrane protein assembly factor BamA [Spirochaetaceae bacterium]|nr:outer membrane protein assembly factor BamA [Spirochaetaceae bacterium]